MRRLLCVYLLYIGVCMARDDYFNADYPGDGRNGRRHASYRSGDDDRADTGEAIRNGMDDTLRELREIKMAQDRGEHVPDYKLLGFLSMPAAVGAPLKGLVNIGQGWVSKQAQGGAQKLVRQYVVPHVKNAQTANYLMHGTTLATGLGVLLADDVGAVYGGMSKYYRDLTDAAAKAAPVLDDIKKGHGFGSAVSVTRDDNEVFYVHKLRLRQDMGMRTKKVGIGIAGKAMNLFDVASNSARHMGYAVPVISEKDRRDPDSVLNLATAGVGSVSEFYKSSIEDDYQRLHKKPTAFTHILELADQIKGNPDIDGFEVKGARRQLPLRDYVAFVFQSHQEEMAGLYPDEYTTIRASLNEPLMQACDKIADAIRQGQIDPLMLVRLVGERQIVKNCGRAIAPAKDVDKVLKHLSGKSKDYVRVTKQDFLSDMTEKELRGGIDQLKGAERLQAMAMVPASVLESMGYAKDEITRAHEHSDFPKFMANAVVGLDEQGEKQLSSLGLDKASIRKLEEVSGDISQRGVEGISKHLTSGVNPDGIERKVLSAVIEKAHAGDVHYLGRLEQAGRKRLASAADAERADGFSGREQAKRHAKDAEDRGLHS